MLILWCERQRNSLFQYVQRLIAENPPVSTEGLETAIKYTVMSWQIALKFHLSFPLENHIPKTSGKAGSYREMYGGS